jgi:hypothetical protein
MQQEEQSFSAGFEPRTLGGYLIRKGAAKSIKMIWILEIGSFQTILRITTPLTINNSKSTWILIAKSVYLDFDGKIPNVCIVTLISIFAG